MTALEKTIQATEKRFNEYTGYLLKTKESLMPLIEFEFTLIHAKDEFVIICAQHYQMALVKDCIEIIKRDGILTYEQFELLTL